MLTRMQARDRYLVSSMAMFLDRNLKTPYDIEAFATSSNPDAHQKFPTPMTIRRAKPDDVTVVRAAPSVAISTIGSGEKDRFFEVGTSSVWRHRSFLFACFPSLDSVLAPCDTAHELLKSYMQDVFETEFIKVIDYSNVLCTPSNILYASDGMYVVNVSDPIDRGQTTALAEEKHRFDVHVTVKIPVVAELVS